MEANYDAYTIIEILSQLDKDKSERILEKCSSPDQIASTMNSTINCLNELCKLAEKMLSDEMIHALLAQKYLEYDRKIKDGNIKCSISNELANFLSDDYEQIEKGKIRGFSIGDIFFEIV